VTVRVPHRTPKVQAEEIANANYEALKEPVLKSVRGKLFGGGPRLNETDLDEAYLLGWHALTEYIVQGNKVENLTGFLVNATYLRARDIARQLHEDRYVDADLETHGVEDDLAERVDDGIKLDRLMDRLKDRLSDQERQAVTLCVLHGFKRPEAAKVLEVSEIRIQKVMDTAMKKIAGVVAGIDTRGCGGDEWARLLRAYALGLLKESDRDYKRAVAHIDDCDTCRRYVTGLRGLAAILPPVGLPLSRLAHEASILAHLYRILGAGHSTATVAQATAGTAGTAATGGGVAGLLGGGAAVKTAAVVAVVALGAATVHVVANDHTVPAHKRPPVEASSTIARREGLTSADPDPLPRPSIQGTGRDRHPGNRRHVTSRELSQSPPRVAAREAEFGFERAHTTRITPAPAAPRRGAAPVPSKEGHSSEFSFEAQHK
jgi:DNA-directed RNA polymerase specialized sigma24 family protein